MLIFSSEITHHQHHNTTVVVINNAGKIYVVNLAPDLI